MSSGPEGRESPRGEGAASRPTAGPPGAEQLVEERGLPAHRLVAWEDEHPGLVAGVTAGDRAGDMGLASGRPPAEWARRLLEARNALGARSLALPVQVHGSRVEEVEGADGGVLIVGEADGLSTDRPGTLLAVTVADCVPVFLLDPEGRSVALVHAGWRGTASGVLEAGLRALEERCGTSAPRVRMHLGPSICGECYEVGAEVPRALGGEASGPVRLDLRAELRERALGLGLRPDRVTRSRACTRCGADHFFSHRGTETAERMMAFLGWREGARAG